MALKVMDIIVFILAARFPPAAVALVFGIRIIVAQWNLKAISENKDFFY